MHHKRSHQAEDTWQEKGMHGGLWAGEGGVWGSKRHGRVRCCANGKVDKSAEYHCKSNDHIFILTKTTYVSQGWARVEQP